MIGAGRLATQFARALKDSGHNIDAVYSRTMQSASALCRLVGGVATDSVADLPTDSDVYIVAVKDSVLPQLLPQLAKNREQRPFFHTAGSVPMSVFCGLMKHYGVIYPMQTFSKERNVDFARVHIFIEGSDGAMVKLARTIAASVSNSVMELSSDDRRQLHLAAVFASNFTNHCYALSAQILEKHGLPFDVMLPLIDEVAAKVHTMSPREAQTGPAVRYDENVISAQIEMLSDNKTAQEVYRIMSKSIHENS